MADTPVPEDVAEGDTGHVELHNNTLQVERELRAEVDDLLTRVAALEAE